MQTRCRLVASKVLSYKREPVPFEVYEPGVYLHGTKADLALGELLVAGRESNFEEGRVMNYVYFAGLSPGVRRTQVRCCRDLETTMPSRKACPRCHR